MKGTFLPFAKMLLNAKEFRRYQIQRCVHSANLKALRGMNISRDEKYDIEAHYSQLPQFNPLNFIVGSSMFIVGYQGVSLSIGLCVLSQQPVTMIIAGCVLYLSVFKIGVPGVRLVVDELTNPYRDYRQELDTIDTFIKE